MIRLPLMLFRVNGESMAPTYHDGDVLMGTCLGRPSPGEVVVVRQGVPLVKRITDRDGDRYWIEGDNVAASTDSREFGWIPREAVVARVIMRVAKG